MESFSKRIAQLRTKRGLTQKDIAEALGVPLSTYKEWEYGRRIQGEKIYVDLAEVLGVSLRSLLTGKPDARIDETLNCLDNAIQHLESAKRSLLSTM